MDPVPANPAELKLAILQFNQEMSLRYLKLDSSINDVAKINSISFPVLSEKRHLPEPEKIEIKKARSLPDQIEAKLGVMQAAMESGTKLMNAATFLLKESEQAFVNCLQKHSEVLMGVDYATTEFLGSADNLELKGKMEGFLDEWKAATVDKEANKTLNPVVEKLKLLEFFLFLPKEIKDEYIPLPASVITPLLHGIAVSNFSYGNITVERQINGKYYRDPLLTLYFSCLLFHDSREASALGWIDELFRKHLCLKHPFSIYALGGGKQARWDNLNWCTFELMRAYWDSVSKNCLTECANIFSLEHKGLLLQPAVIQHGDVKTIFFPLIEAIFPFSMRLRRKGHEKLLIELGNFVLNAIVKKFWDFKEQEQLKNVDIFALVLSSLHHKKIDVQIEAVMKNKERLLELDMKAHPKAKHHGFDFLDQKYSNKKAVPIFDGEDLFNKTIKQLQPVSFYVSQGGLSPLIPRVFLEREENAAARRRLTADKLLIKAFLYGTAFVELADKLKDQCSPKLLDAIAKEIAVVADSKTKERLGHLLFHFADDLEMKKEIIRTATNVLPFIVPNIKDQQFGKTQFIDFWVTQRLNFAAIIRKWDVEISGKKMAIETLVEQW